MWAAAQGVVRAGASEADSVAPGSQSGLPCRSLQEVGAGLGEARQLRAHDYPASENLHWLTDCSSLFPMNHK